MSLPFPFASKPTFTTPKNYFEVAPDISYPYFARNGAKILILPSGDFVLYGSNNHRCRMMKFHINGTVDASFSLYNQNMSSEITAAVFDSVNNRYIIGCTGGSALTVRVLDVNGNLIDEDSALIYYDGTNYITKILIMPDTDVLVCHSGGSFGANSAVSKLEVDVDGLLIGHRAGFTCLTSYVYSAHLVDSGTFGGDVIFVGGFNSTNATTAPRVNLISNTGSLIGVGSGFTENVRVGAGNMPGDTIFDVDIDADNKILLVGNFITESPAVVRKGIMRLNTDGTIDTSLVDTDITTSISQVLSLSGGSILITGNSMLSGGSSTISKIVKLTSNGGHDNSFIPFGKVSPNAITHSAYDDIHNRIYLIGSFTAVNNINITSFAKINISGFS